MAVQPEPGPASAAGAPGRRPRALALAAIATAQVLGLTLWFSATAVAPDLASAWRLSPAQVVWLTTAVQLGFVVGAIGLAAAGVPDRVGSRQLFGLCASLGAACNAALLVIGDDAAVAAILLRGATGVALAGVYPSGLKAVAGWFRRGRGMAMGSLVGALTLGSAAPHLVARSGLSWQGVVLASSLLALLGAAVMVGLVSDGPYEAPASRFAVRHLRTVLANRGFRLATTAYLGHMWELYAMWTWAASYVAASLALRGAEGQAAGTLTFAVIASGGVGAVVAGVVADRRGRLATAGAALATSGCCAALTPAVFGAAPAILLALLLVWGVTVVADSAQFSAMVTELVEERVRGTALTVQTALGFLLSVGSIRLVPLLAHAAGWRWAFLLLVPGPVVGVAALVRLSRDPLSARLPAVR